MNAVNLIPSDRRKGSVSVSASPLTLGVIGGLVVVLVAAVLYVLAANDVQARKSELARVTANATSWQAAANSYGSYVTAAQQQKQQLVDIKQLVSGRFPWTTLLGQIGGLMPANAALSSLQAISPSADSTAATASTGSTPSAPASTQTQQAVQIAGCAASQSAVAATMVALGKVHGISSVVLSSTTDGSGAAGGSGSSGSSSSSGSGSSASGGCPFPVNFMLSLVLATPSSAASTPTSASSSSPATTPTASTTATPTTGSAQ